MLLSCSNKSTKPDFLVSDLVGKWTNPKNKQDYFRITDGGFLESQGVYIVINDWNPRERVEYYSLYATDKNGYKLHLRFTSQTHCEFYYRNQMVVYTK